MSSAAAVTIKSYADCQRVMATARDPSAGKPLGKNTRLVRVKSHRAREKMKAALGRLPVGYFSFRFAGEFREVSTAEWEKLQGIKGLSRARVDRAELRRYWTD
jgi:hypothetical protein